MSRPYSMDLRDRALARVLAGESVRTVAGKLSISAATVVRWSQKYRASGSVAAGKVGGHKVGILAGQRDWLLERAKSDFTLRGLVAELAARGVKVDYVQVWRFAHAEGLSFKKKAFFPPNSSGPRSPGGACSGRSSRGGLTRGVWSSSMRPGPRPTWRPCAAGHRSASGFMPRCPMAIGRR